MLRETKKQATETKTEGTRAPPSVEGKTSRETKYWTPKLTNAEWSLLNRTLKYELSNKNNYIDKNTKWAYARERGVDVFAIYGIGDGTEATILFAEGGKNAYVDSLYVKEIYQEVKNGTVRTTETYHQWFKNMRHVAKRNGDSRTDAQNRKTTVGDSGVFRYDSRQSSEQQNDNAKGNGNRGDINEISDATKSYLKKREKANRIKYLEERLRSKKVSPKLKEEYRKELKELKSEFKLSRELKMLTNGEFSVVEVKEDIEDVKSARGTENQRSSNGTYGRTGVPGKREADSIGRDKVGGRSVGNGKENRAYSESVKNTARDGEKLATTDPINKAVYEKHNVAKRLTELNKKMRHGGLTAEEKSERAAIKEKYHFSQELDSAGNELTPEQAEYFKDSKVVDRNGKLQATEAEICRAAVQIGEGRPLTV